MDRQKQTLTLAIEYVGTPELVVEWLPVRETEKVPIPMRPIESVREREVTISIPSGATGVEAILLAMGLDADKMSCRVNWENTLLRIGEFFDTDQKRLGNLLFQEHSLRNVNPFELGLARLLGLAGFVVLWFGKAAKEALPDLIAYKRKPRGEELIIYAECTLKNPSEKFSDLAKRTEELRRFLGYEPGGILSVVFVRNEASAQDRRAASEFGLTLCDGSDIRKLHDRILSDASPGELVQFFRALNDPLAIQLRSTFP